MEIRHNNCSLDDGIAYSFSQLDEWNGVKGGVGVVVVISVVGKAPTNL